MRLIMITCSLLIACLLFPYSSFADENERYKAVPLGSGGIFIIDSKEGHTWTWSNKGGHNIDGKNSSLVYQGSVRSNMKLKKKQKVNLENDSHASLGGEPVDDEELRY